MNAGEIQERKPITSQKVVSTGLFIKLFKELLIES